MSDYAIFFDYNDNTYRLPVNPQEMNVDTIQAIEKYNVLKLGEVAIPTHLELRKYSFECEFPKELKSYVETPSDFKGVNFYTSLFRKWRSELVPVRFIASNGGSDDINTLVLIESLYVTERAGEEGDKYISFELLEYKRFGKKMEVVVKPNNKVKTAANKPALSVNPKSKGTHTVVKGDTLWAIAKKYYSKGNEYPKIFNANKDKIKNPNLIYPKQVLVIP